MRLYRLIAIMALMETRGSMKAQELAETLEVSTRTIYRDVETLCEAGIPVAATTGPNGGIYLMEDYQVNPVHLNGDDAVNLYLSGIMGKSERPEDSTARLRESLLRLEKTLPKGYGVDIRAARERFFFDDASWWGKQSPPECLGTLRQAVLRLKKLKIDYEKPNGTASCRVVRPYGLVVKNGGWYMIAYCETSGDLRTFKADRIKHAEMLQEGFDIPADFCLEKQWRSGVGNFVQDRQGREQYQVIILLPSPNQWLLEQLEVMETWTVGETIYAKVNMHRSDFAIDEALKIIWQAEIVSPDELRSKIASRLFELSRSYLIQSEDIPQS